jgi:hypothetical protein
MSFSISDPSTRASVSVSLISMDLIHCIDTGERGADTLSDFGILDSLPDASNRTSCQWPVASFETEGDFVPLKRLAQHRISRGFAGNRRLHFKEES